MAKHNNARGSLEDDSKRVYDMVRQFSGRDVDWVISRVSERLKLRKHDVARRIYELKENGLIDLIDPNPPRTLVRYLFSTYCTWFWLIASIVFLMFITIYVLPNSPPYIYLRYVLGSVFVLYLPGSSLIELLYPKPEELSQLERLALSIGLSLALVPLAGLILNYTPWGIRLDPVFIVLSLLTVSLACGAVYRKFIIFKLKIHTLGKVGLDE